MIKFTIPLPPRTKKNSQNLIVSGGKHIPIPSKAFTQYQRDSGNFLPCKWLLIDKPINVKALYYLDANRTTDIINLHSALHDIFVHYGVVKDDSAINPSIIVGTDGSRVYVDKENPRTEIEITEADL